MKTTMDVVNVMCECGVRLAGKYKETGMCAKCTKKYEEIGETVENEAFDTNVELNDTDSIMEAQQDKELLSIYEHKLRIDNAIKYAVNQGALRYELYIVQQEKLKNGVKIPKHELIECPKFVSNKQLKGIIKNYELRTSVEMNSKQIDFLKTLNPIQVQFIGITLNKARSLALA